VVTSLANQQEMGQDMVRRKRKSTILSDDEVLEIRRQYKAGVSTRDLAEKFGVSHAQTFRIATRKQRKDVK